MKTKLLVFTSEILIIISLLILVVLPVQEVTAESTSPTPMLAYYYIWFDTNSWDRAKTDYPLLGKYTSDDRAVMRQHILWAKNSGVNGFIVSWKSTEVLNRRLSLLADVAEEENFKLAVIYQGLDFDRNPLPADRIAADLDTFVKDFGPRPSFQIFSKPLVIWSGTWKFSPEDIEKVTASRRTELLILGSEKNVSGYQRIAKYVDGDAYYWSSVNPDTYKGYPDKLIKMGDAVHNNGGLWIPPAAPGFDARLLGGSSYVERKDGATLITQINSARKSSPDALGLISWNEFSENSQIEPSVNYKSRSLEILSSINHLPVPVITDLDSSDPYGQYPEGFTGTRIAAIGGLITLMFSGIFVLFFRQAKAIQVK